MKRKYEMIVHYAGQQFRGKFPTPQNAVRIARRYWMKQGKPYPKSAIHGTFPHTVVEIIQE